MKDGPYCGITSAHTSYKYVKTIFPSKRSEKYNKHCLVKGRNEPCCVLFVYTHILINRQVLEVIATCHNVTVKEAADIIYHNTLELYFPWEL
jgi:TatD DNase family protein